MFSKIYIISLKEDEARRARISEELDGIGFTEYEFIDAIKGSNLPNTQILTEAEVLADTFIDPFGLLNKNIIGCALSHKKAYQKFLDDSIKSALILEDDARWSPEGYKFILSGKIDAIKSELKRVDWDIFMWGLVGDNIPHYMNTPAGFKWIREYKKYSPDWAAHAYHITRKGAEKLLANNTPIQFAADVNLETSGCNIYCTPWSLIEQGAGSLSRLQADNLANRLKPMLYSQGFESHTIIKSDKQSLTGVNSYDLYFSADRNIRFESKTYKCEISKDIDFKRIEFKEYTDTEGTVNNNWCHITF